jgi:hypothetical protein
VRISKDVSGRQVSAEHLLRVDRLVKEAFLVEVQAISPSDQETASPPFQRCPLGEFGAMAYHQIEGMIVGPVSSSAMMD